MNPLPRSFYSRDSEEMARNLLGKVVSRGYRKGKITEAEAYHGKGDPDSHALNGATPRNGVMFGEVGGNRSINRRKPVPITSST